MSNFFLIGALTLAAVAMAMLIMAIGVIFAGKCMRGNCGGDEVVGADGERLSCDDCPKRKEREAQAKAKQVA